MKSIVSIEVGNYKSEIQSVDFEKLNKAIENYNNKIIVFNVPNPQNYLMLDVERIKAFINNCDKLPPDLGNIVLSSPHTFFSINLPKFNLAELHNTKWVSIYKGDVYKEHKVLYIPFIKEELNEIKSNALNNKKTFETEILKQTEQEIELRKQQNNPEKLKLLLTELITNKRKLVLCLKNLIYLTKIQLSENPLNQDLLLELESYEMDIKNSNVMLFESLPR